MGTFHRTPGPGPSPGGRGADVIHAHAWEPPDPPAGGRRAGRGHRERAPWPRLLHPRRAPGHDPRLPAGPEPRRGGPGNGHEPGDLRGEPRRLPFHLEADPGLRPGPAGGRGPRRRRAALRPPGCAPARHLPAPPAPGPRPGPAAAPGRPRRRAPGGGARGHGLRHGRPVRPHHRLGPGPRPLLPGPGRPQGGVPRLHQFPAHGGVLGRGHRLPGPGPLHPGDPGPLPGPAAGGDAGGPGRQPADPPVPAGGVPGPGGGVQRLRRELRPLQGPGVPGPDPGAPPQPGMDPRDGGDPGVPMAAPALR